MRPAARRRLAWAALLLAPLVLRDDLSRYALARLAAFALAATGVSVVSGLAGQISLGHAALMAAGGFTSAGLALHADWPFLAAFPAGTALAVAVGLALGAPSLRLRGQYLALATLGGGAVVYQVVRQDPRRWTGGDLGLASIPAASAAGHALGALGTALLALGLLALGLFFAGNLPGSRAGRAFRAVRDAEDGAEASGISVFRVKLSAFVLSAAFAGAGGALVAHGDGFLSIGSFDPRGSLLLVLAAVLGGLRSPYGGTIGVLAILGPAELAPSAFSWLRDYQLLTWGSLALVVVFRWPDGIAGGIGRLVRARRRKPAPEGGPAGEKRAPAAPKPARVPATPRPPRAPAPGEPALEARGIEVRYGGVVALAGVDLTVRAGTIHALIGPNGSGKTTLLDVLCGFARADRGSVSVAGEIVDGRAPHLVQRMGVGRTFQSVAVFDSMSALDNLLAGAHGRLTGGALRAGLGLAAPGEAAIAAEAAASIEAAGLAGRAADPAGALSYGQRKRLELARALSARPWLLMLDEPAAGRNEPEILELRDDLARLRASGVTVLLVEHHMNFVLSVADAVTVLDEGRVIAEGPPSEVRSDPAVIVAYLGADVA
ncbi:MAG: branched-chain amino acid ABC transporter ATP-binding protein/permease [Acidobacteria bacterium]|nr:branched-chain amino acid ABC transporter ATP-binding protein/permease [Acidobacteriota bacterium]